MKNMFLAAALLAALPLSGCTCTTVQPGERGVKVDWGKLSEPIVQEGFTITGPGVHIDKVSIRQQKEDLETTCFSSDLQQVHVKMNVRYRIPEAGVIRIYRDYHGKPFDVLVAAQVQEALKEATAGLSAEQIVKQRETIKLAALEHARKKVGDVLVLEDIVLTDISLSNELESAIEAKMVQQQQAEKAKYTTQLAEQEAATAIAKADGEAKAVVLRATADAKSIAIRGEALQKNPGVMQLQLIEKWDGKSPQIVSGQSGVNILLPSVK